MAILGKLGGAIEHDLTPHLREVLLVLALNGVPIDVVAERVVPRRCRLAGIIFNLLTYSGWYDIALRAFGLMLGALTLARLASVYDPPFGRRRPTAVRRAG